METIITQKTALLAKEKGFNYNPEYYFYPNDKRNGYNILQKSYCFGGDTRTIEYHYLNGDYSLVIPAPSQSLLAKWLREVHNIIVLPDWEGSDGYFYKINFDSFYDVAGKNYKRFEDAFEQGLLEGLNLIPTEF